MRVLVTGGAGYIGSHTTRRLAAAGFETAVFDNLGTGHRWAVRWGPLFEGDLNDEQALAAAFATFRPDAVVHFAASAYVGESVQYPRKYFHNNVVASLSLLDAMLDFNVKTIVFSSSCTTYGMPQRLPLTEDHPQAAVSPYGESKLFVEHALRWYAQAYGLRFAALRYFNAAGADPDGELGEVHHPETHLIPLAIQAAAGQRPLLEVYGDDYPTPDGTAIRDYIHVADLAEAHALALQHLTRGGESLAVNLGTGRGYSVREVLTTVERIGGLRVPTHVGPRRSGDPPALVADPTQALRVLDWRPQYSSLETIVQTAWRWHAELADKVETATR
ncbi:MAG: UDP-glucose 4-epimerase GalE [Chloroflexi bacterium]|nr:UDP-glucose 4-epimerase GalE [Chloroflexota bacterium]